MQKIDIDYDVIYHSNFFGDYKIIEEVGIWDKQRHVKIKFFNTGSERIITLGHAMSGEVRDLYAKTVYGVGYLGDFIDDEFKSIIYRPWASMIGRCYGVGKPFYTAYGGIGVKVADEWHCFANFQQDAKYLYNYENFINNPAHYELDKDYLQQNIPKPQRIYSKQTCVFLLDIDNNNLHALENNMLNQDSMSSKYIGISRCRDKTMNYEAIIRLNGKKFRIGTFINEIAAANAYNYYFDKFVKYELVRLHNDVPYMPPEIWSQYRSRKIEVIKIVK